MIRPQCRICKLRLEGGHGGYRTKSKKAIKLVILLKHLPYIERLRQLNLPTLKYRGLNAAARIVTAVAPGSMIKDCHIYCILSCTGWMFRSGSCISLLWSSTDVSRTRRRSICRTTVCQSLKLPCSRQQLRSSSRHQPLLIPRYRLRIFSRWAFAMAGPTFWNSLADELRTYSSDRFKLALKTFLFATY